MTAVLHQHPPSILIRSQSASSLPTYHHNSTQSPVYQSESSSDAASSSSHTNISQPTFKRQSNLRRIHFAPLPDPRRPSGHTPLAHSADSVSETVSESPVSPVIASSPRDSSDSPLGSCFSPDSYGPPSLPHPCSSQDNSSNPSTTSLPQRPRSPPTSWSRPNRLFKPFLKRGSSPAPGGLGITAEELLTLGAINLFRTTSKESQASRRTQSADDGGGGSHGWGLSRWASAGSSDSKAGTDRFSSSLPRTQSIPTLKDSGKSKSKAKQTSVSPSLSTSVPSSSNMPTPPPTLNPPASGLATLSNIRVRKGTRMLNGRVYGAGRPHANANPFASARDAEPEFVEWGYGGMGSVKNAAGSGSAMWGRLQSQGGVMVGSVEGAPVVEEEEDDGSGMAWVRKRREKREKERLAREEAEKMAAQSKEREQPSSSSAMPQDPESHAHAPLSALPPTSTDTNPGTLPQPQKDTGPDLRTNPISTTTPSEPIPTSDSFERHEILTASVPSHLHRRISSGRRISDQGSVGALAGPSSAFGPGSSPAPPSSTGSVDDEDEDSGEGNPLGGSDDEDDDSDEVALRMTSRCAAVEKISRHKDDRQSL